MFDCMLEQHMQMQAKIYGMPETQPTLTTMIVLQEFQKRVQRLIDRYEDKYRKRQDRKVQQKLLHHERLLPSQYMLVSCFCCDFWLGT